MENQLLDIDSKIAEWIERGKKIIYQENFEDWTSCVKNRANDSYHGADLECALEIMEALDKGIDMDEIEEFLNRANYSEQAHFLILKIILAFSKFGPEFMEHITHGDITTDLQQAIENQRQENEKYEQAALYTKPTIENTVNETLETEANTEYEPMDINVSLQVIKKQSIFTKIINFIKGLFKPKHKLLGSEGDYDYGRNK